MMLFDLFKTKPALDQDSVQWLIDVYAWALENFDAEIFYQHTQLVMPNNEFFPGRAESADQMAGIIFDKVKDYAHLSHWPCLVVEQRMCPSLVSPSITIDGPIRRTVEDLVKYPIRVSELDQKLMIQYDQNQIRNPEAVIANFAHTLSHYLGAMRQTKPPGVEENWAQATEVLCVFLGFGVIMANSAFNFKNITCGSCHNPNSQRSAFLSQYDITYALGIFASLKQIPDKVVLRGLKSSLRPYYKRVTKELKNNAKSLDILREIDKIKN